MAMAIKRGCMSMKNWSKQQKREHEVMEKFYKFNKTNPPTGKMDAALEAYYSNKNAIQEYEGRLKNLNVYLGDSVERISQLMEEV
jgi:hypothetical protein